jgi:hypothetical protein
VRVGLQFAYETRNTIRVGLKGAPITVRCDCGEVEYVPYGVTWQCNRCGRRWNTNQIPADEYWRIMRDMRRLRISVVAIALGLALVFGLLALFVAESLILLLQAVLAFWFIWYMPWWRRKVRRRARDLPKWNLRPE